ncbi:MAG: 3-hydroxybenzoate 6-hydroxylase 1 [Pseudomonadota bacterium]
MTKHRLKKVLIAGGGIGGLAAALACARQGLPTQLWERAAQLSEVGAGIQLGPNVTRILQAWGLSDALNQVAAFPERLQARDARTGEVLGVLRLGARAQNRYGAPYVTLHRADLQGLLHESAQAHGVDIRLGKTLQSWQALADGLEVGSVAGDNTKADALIGADGVWSAVRQQWRGDGPAQFTGHVAYRALLSQADLPLHLRSQEVTVWMGPRLHVVHYPVRGGEALNLVAIVQAERPTHSQEWDAAGHAQALLQAMGARSGAVGKDLMARIEAVSGWRQWALHDRAPMSSPLEMAEDRVALLGDAAHPMRPYLAQGAGMAIEDALVLSQCLAQGQCVVSERLKTYAERRWSRNAQVQTRAIRNGRIFHAQGWVATGRNLSMRLMSERLMDVPWLYGQGPQP